jgi:putative restriction endonuclease
MPNSQVKTLKSFLNGAVAPAHRAALLWFAENAGRVLPWREIRLPGTILRCAPKGIYKPRGVNYALSIRQTLRSPYHDFGPTTGEDGSWLYKYHEEVTRGEAEGLFTNRGLNWCMDESIPVGVLRQVTGKKDENKYQVLGPALVIGYNEQYFYLQGFSAGGTIQPIEWEAEGQRIISKL